MKPPRLLRFIAWTLAVLVVLSAAAYLLRQPLLLAAGKLWIVDEPVIRADAVVVLGGGAQTRPFAAAAFVRQGLASNVLLAMVQPDATDQLGITTPDSDTSRAVLAKKGVPPNFIHSLGTNVASTYDEARALRTWAIEKKPKTIIIPTELFHTRRVNWLMEKQLRDLNVDVRVVALDTPHYGRTNWWAHEAGVVAFQNEVIKYALYRWRY